MVITVNLVVTQFPVHIFCSNMTRQFANYSYRTCLVMPDVFGIT